MDYFQYNEHRGRNKNLDKETKPTSFFPYDTHRIPTTRDLSGIEVKEIRVFEDTPKGAENEWITQLQSPKQPK